ncbi:MAG: hypothetical protein ACLUFK_11750 [Oscillospiraceae bacterium]
MVRITPPPFGLAGGAGYRRQVLNVLFDESADYLFGGDLAVEVAEHDALSVVELVQHLFKGENLILQYLDRLSY